ncbi:MAG TPA: hypothetical protein VHV83_21100, partial [Armatimonadota bacterium]|nr:hypothetical protein [Armatimonadota bacterium]
EYRFYLDSLISGAPQCFISELPSFITRITPTPEATNGSIIRSARLAGPIYGFLIQGGGVEYAKVLHTRVQAALTAKQLTDIAAIDEKQYQQSFSIKSLEGIYQLFTKAVARDDIADAKRLMNQLTDIAPEDPRAIHARTTYRTILSKGDKK